MIAGDKVRMTLTENSFYKNAKWWQATMTGTVQKVHKNGNIRVACHQLKNGSEDGMITKTFSQKDVVFEVIN